MTRRSTRNPPRQNCEIMAHNQPFSHNCLKRFLLKLQDENVTCLHSCHFGYLSSCELFKTVMRFRSMVENGKYFIWFKLHMKVMINIGWLVFFSNQYW